MNITLQLPKLTDLKPRITVIGVGGAGGNAVNNMIASGLDGVTFVVANTDAQALAASSAEHRLQLGVTLTEGLGAGSRPEIGQAAAEEAVDEIRNQVSGSHMVFIAAGMGGGTGTGAAAVIARVAKELGILTIGVVTKPFHFEGSRRMRVAEAGIAELRKYVDTLIVIPNQNLFLVATERTTFAEAFVLADQVLYSAVACIVDLIVKDGLINLDLADVRTILTGMGTSMMGTGEASGENRATIAAEEAIANPLLDNVSLKGAKGLLLSITGGKDLTLYEVDEAASRVRREVDPDANIIVGATFDESLSGRIRVSIVASGMDRTDGEGAVGARLGGLLQATGLGGLKGRQRKTGGPPPLRPSPRERQAWPAGEDELTRALSEAMHQTRHGASTERLEPGERWRAADGAEFEEAPPDFGQPAEPPAPTSAPRSTGFEPAPPVERRRGPRRMPAIEDFPPVGQREYQAKLAAAGGSDGAAPRKASLIERLMGVRQRTAEGRAGSAAAQHRAAASGDRARRTDAPADSEPPMQPANRVNPADDDVELPVFFDQERRG
ncbi:MAG TPA: cell division protein FtsZ [Hyphomicrobiaceae bacterium]|nr:cell division protein FtsZ [Hyphomicrobiaceae bacterium]